MQWKGNVGVEGGGMGLRSRVVGGKGQRGQRTRAISAVLCRMGQGCFSTGFPLAPTHRAASEQHNAGPSPMARCSAAHRNPARHSGTLSRAFPCQPLPP